MEGIRAIILDEDLWVTSHLSKALVEIGYVDCLVSNDPGIAQTEIQKFNPSLILIDIDFGGQNTGIQIVRKLATDKGQKVIYLSKHVSDSIIKESADTEPLDFILKPLKPGQLSVTLELILSRIDPVLVRH